ncbi:unnamed protein product [Leptidea sinapis]|nr:unnamed protein product [Leptidea sinapis]
MEDLNIVLSECINETIYNEYKVKTQVSRIYYCHNSKRQVDVDVDIGDWIFAVIILIIFFRISKLERVYLKRAKGSKIKKFSRLRRDQVCISCSCGLRIINKIIDFFIKFGK